MLQLGGQVVMEDKAKTRASRRRIWLDRTTIELLKAHEKAQKRAQLAAPPGTWQDNDLVFCRDDGTPWPPDYVSRRFKALSGQAGVPVIKLHEGGRHTASSLGHDAGVDPEIRQRALTETSNAFAPFATCSGWSTWFCKLVVVKYSSNALPFTSIFPVPVVMRMRATAVLRRPVAIKFSVSAMDE